MGAQVRAAHQPRLPRAAGQPERLEPLGQARQHQRAQRADGPRERAAQPGLHPHPRGIHLAAAVQRSRPALLGHQRAVRHDHRSAEPRELVRLVPVLGSRWD